MFFIGLQLLTGTGVLQHGGTQTNVAQVTHSTNTHPTNRPKVHFCADCGKGFAARHGLQQHNRRYIFFQLFYNIVIFKYCNLFKSMYQFYQN